MPTSGLAKLPYPNSTAAPDVPADLKVLADRVALMGGAGIGYLADDAARLAVIASGDAFTGWVAYHAAADCLIKYNGAAFKLWGSKTFATTTTRDSWTTTYSALLEDGSACFVADTDQRFIHNGTTWADVTTGLFPVIPATVAGSGVTVGLSGKVTATAAASVSLNGCFTAAFENYQIVLDITSKSTSAQIQALLRLAGVDNVANYDYQLDYGSGSAPGTAPGVGTAAWQLSVLNVATFHKADIIAFSPAIVTQTAMLSRMGDFTITAAPTIVNGGLSHRTAAAFDGLTIKPTAGTITGTIRVYGYNNN